LPATGVIDSKAMIEALNVPADPLAQLQAGLKRLRLAPSTAGRYVVVNIPPRRLRRSKAAR
jgi:murein L,D-transpeptidase YcbB/YkuD